MTRELLAEADLAIEGDFEELMEEQRERGRGGAVRGGAGAGSSVTAIEALDGGVVTRFTGYETEVQPTTVVAIRPLDAVGAANGSSGGDGGKGHDGGAPKRLLVKLAESPFYAAGGGQISDVGTIECAHGDCVARVEDVLLVGEDRIPEVIVEAGALDVGEQVLARVDHRDAAQRPSAITRRPTCCRRRCASGSAATCARRAPTWGRTSCASISATGRR